MSNLLVSVDGPFTGRSYSAITQYNRRELFAQDPIVLNADNSLRMRVEASGKRRHPIAVHTCWSRYALNRTRRHIRNDRSQFAVVNYVSHGSARVVREGCELVSRAGSLLILPMSEPFQIEFIPGDECYRAVFLPLSLPILQDHISAYGSGMAITTDGQISQAARELLEMLYRCSDELNRPAFEAIVSGFLHQIAPCFENSPGHRSSAEAQRREEIIGFLKLNVAKPGLNLATVADHFGLSVRYLTKLFQHHETSFERTLWNIRLSLVREWLASAERRNMSIAELGYSAGFKSPSHLSNMFQRQYAMSPRAFRKLHDPESSAASTLL